MIGLIELVVLAFLLWGGFMLFTLVKKGGGWAVAGVIAAVVLIAPVVLVLVAIFSWRMAEVVPGVDVRADDAAAGPLAVRVEQQHADSVRVIRDSQAEIERARQDVERARQYDVAANNADRDAAAVVQLHLDATALDEHHVSTADLAEAIATLCELVALAGDDHPIEVSQLGRIRLAGPDDEPLPLAAVLGDLSRSTNLLAKAASPRVIRVVAKPSADLGPANADELAAELITHDELVESTIQGTFTQEVSGHTVRLQVYQRESLTDEEQQLADAASAQIIATLLTVESAETTGAADIALLAASESQAEPSPADTEESDTEKVDTEESDAEEVDAEESGTEETASGDEQAADASDDVNDDDEIVDEPVADVTDTDESGGDEHESDEEAVADTEPATEDEAVTDAVAEATDTAEEVESLEAAVAASKAVLPVAAVAPAAIDAPIEMSLSVEIDTSPERPDWVNDEDELKNDGVFRATVSAGPYATRIECDRALDDEILRATEDYLEHLQPNVGDFDTLDRSYLRSTLVKALWEERRDTSVGPMRIIHARLEFTPEVQHHLQVLTRQRIVNRRLTQTGAVSGIVLALLATFFGYFKLDTLTKGYYSTRLKLVAAVMILGLLGMLLPVLH